MTIKMRLDTEALRALIGSNPDLQIELEQAVIRNITDDLLKANISQRVDGYLNTIATKGGTYYSPTYTLSSNFAEAVRTVVKEQAQRMAEAEINTLVRDSVQSQMTRLRIELQGEFKALMRSLLTSEMAVELMREKLLA